MFPTAQSTVYYNEAGEPLGWSDESYFEPEYDPYDHDDDMFDLELDVLDEGDDGLVDLP